MKLHTENKEIYIPAIAAIDMDLLSMSYIIDTQLQIMVSVTFQRPKVLVSVTYKRAKGSY